MQALGKTSTAPRSMKADVGETISFYCHHFYNITGWINWVHLEHSIEIPNEALAFRSCDFAPVIMRIRIYPGEKK